MDIDRSSAPQSDAAAGATSPQDAPLVLVIDDDGMMRMLVRGALECGGFRVEEAEDGETGLALVRSLQPDVVLLDLVLPGMDGFSTCAALRGLEGVSHIPVLMMTGLDDAASLSRAYAAGATGFVTKPIVWPTLPHKVRDLLRNAGSAMRFARQKDNHQALPSDESAGSARKLTRENDLRRALEHGELRLHYQPKVDAASGRVAGVEALIRWEHPELGMVAPNDFIPLAQESGLIIPIGEWVLHEACERLFEWRAAGFTDITVAVNMSADNFFRKGFVDAVATTVRGACVPPRAVEIEIAESVLMRDMQSTIATLAELKAAGVRLAVDNAGTGSSTIDCIKGLPLDTLKIDRTFVRDVLRNREDAASATAVIALARSLGLQVVAEGVETREQAEFLRAGGCQLMQGYLFSRPMPAEEITAILEGELVGV